MRVLSCARVRYLYVQIKLVYGICILFQNLLYLLFLGFRTSEGKMKILIESLYIDRRTVCLSVGPPKLKFYKLIFVVHFIQNEWLCYILCWLTIVQSNRGAGAQSDCKIDWFWVRSPVAEMKYVKYINLYVHFFTLVSRQSAALSSATQYTLPQERKREADQEYGGKWGTECLNTRFPLPTCCCVRDTAWSWFLFKYFISSNGDRVIVIVLVSHASATAPRLATTVRSMIWVVWEIVHILMSLNEVIYLF